MTLPLTTSDVSDVHRTMLSKVPEVTLLFWAIKIMATTVGETAADYLNFTLGLGLTVTSVITAVLTTVAIVAQFRANRYIPSLYWTVVLLISVMGTLITDNLTDNVGIPLQVTTIVFSVALAVVFLAWRRVEGTLSIHSITTRRREAFYWLAILLTFALGTAGGDLLSETMSLGYLMSGLLIAAVIGLITAGHLKWGLNAVFAFWAAYILTRPLGASLGDLLTQPTSNGGLGLGTSAVSLVFLALIVGGVGYLTATRKDVIPVDDEQSARAA